MERLNRDVCVADALHVASHSTGDLAEGSRWIVGSIDLTGDIARLRLGAPRLDASNVPEAEVLPNFVAVGDGEDRDLEQGLSGLARQFVVDGEA